MKYEIRFLLLCLTITIPIHDAAAQETLKLSNGDKLHGEIK